MFKLFHNNRKGDVHMIKFFSDTSSQSLESKVNSWVEEQGIIEVINMSYVILKERVLTCQKNDTLFLFLIVY